MISALYRGMLWLAALAAAAAVLGPDDTTRLLLAGVAVIAALSAWTLRRVDRSRSVPWTRADASVPAPLALGAAPLAELSLRLRQVCADAAQLEPALHESAALLKGELGAREAIVYRVRHTDDVRWHVQELIASRPGWPGASRDLGAADAVLREALDRQRDVMAVPKAIAIPVVCGDVAVAAMQLSGIEIAIEAEPLARLIESTREAFAELAARTEPNALLAPDIAPDIAPDTVSETVAPRQVLIVVEDAAAAADLVPPLHELGCEVRIACGRQQGLHALGETRFDAVLIDACADAGKSELADIGALSQWRRAARERLLGATSVPMILIRSDVPTADESQFFQLDFDGLIRKPLRPAHLLTMLTRPTRPQAASPAQGHAAAATLLDAGALARLAELDPTGKTRLLPRVLTAYTNSVARMRPQLVAAMPTRDLAAIRHVTHTLKSSSASIGALQLAALCAEIDNMIRTDSLADLNARVDSMCAELENVLQAVKQLLDGHP